MLATVLKAFGISDDDVHIKPLQNGLIHHTWKITTENEAYILQKINDGVFENPFDIAENIALLSKFLAAQHPAYYFVTPVLSIQGAPVYYQKEHGYFRMFPFVPNSHTIPIVTNAEQAFEAAHQFGKFTAMLKDFDNNKLITTIPFFHDLPVRQQHFLQAIKTGNPERIHRSESLVKKLLTFSRIVDEFLKIKTNHVFTLRVTHHDTKISNVLFDESDKGICVIDLDTVMPGYFISDVGDMMRTYLSPVSEEESDFDKVDIRDDIFSAIAHGYLSAMKDQLSPVERNHFLYAGAYMMYMQAIRFLTDYLQDDVYYDSSYPDHNYVRAGNQAVLLEKFLEKQIQLSALVP